MPPIARTVSIGSHSVVGIKQVGSTVSTYNPAYRNGTLEGPDRSYYAKYEYAFRTEPVINRALNFICYTMLSSIGDYTHPDTQIQDFVRENIASAPDNLQNWMSALILSSLVYGRGNSEILWEARDGKIYLAGLANYHPRSIHLVTDLAGRLVDGKRKSYHEFFPKTGVWQELPFEVANSSRSKVRDWHMQYVRIPLNKMVIVTHNKRFGNFDGESALAPIWLTYQMKSKTFEDLMITAERYGSPQVAAIVPYGLTSNMIEDAAGNTRPETIAESAARSLENMSVSTALVLEEPTGVTNAEKIRLQTLTTGNNFGSSYLDTINKLNHEMLLGMGLPPLLFLEHTGGLGSGNVSATQAEAYKQTMVALYKEFIEPFTEQVIGRLIKYNFGDHITDFGRFEFNPFDIAAAETLVTIIDKAIDAGIIDTSEAEDLQLARARLGFPQLTPEAMAKRLKKNERLMEIRRNPELAQQEMAKLQAETQLKVADRQLEAQAEASKARAQQSQAKPSSTKRNPL